MVRVEVMGSVKPKPNHNHNPNPKPNVILTIIH